MANNGKLSTHSKAKLFVLRIARTMGVRTGNSNYLKKKTGDTTKPDDLYSTFLT